jgi:sodium-dependent dicarboxylate transporter 2/3/5
VSGLLPIAVTALLSMVMLPLLGIMEAKKTYALFGNEAVFFILGAFILAAAMTGTGLSARLARAMLARFGKTPTRLALTVFLLSAFLSFVMSEHAVAAMMFPVVGNIGARPEKGTSGYRLLFMSVPGAHQADRHLPGGRGRPLAWDLRENQAFSFLE